MAERWHMDGEADAQLRRDAEARARLGLASDHRRRRGMSGAEKTSRYRERMDKGLKVYHVEFSDAEVKQIAADPTLKLADPSDRAQVAAAIRKIVLARDR